VRDVLTASATQAGAPDNIRGHGRIDALAALQNPIPTIQFASAASEGLETVSPAVIEVTLSAPFAHTVSAQCRVSGGTSTGGVDRVCQPRVITFAPGETMTTVPITIFNDTQGEPDETVILSLSDVSRALSGAPASHIYTIHDNDPPVIQFESDRSWGSETTSPARLAVSLSIPWTDPVSVNYRVSAGTSTGGGVDRTCLPGTLTFAPGETRNFIEVFVTNDDLPEPDESVTIALSSPVNGSLGSRKTHTYWILNDDGLGGASARFCEASSSASESAGAVKIAVALTHPLATPAQVNYRVTGGTSTGGVDRVCSPGVLTFAPGEMLKDFTITIYNDKTPESNETVIVTLSEPSGALLGAPSSHTLTIVDDDTVF